jgi:hypothetical protein
MRRLLPAIAAALSLLAAAAGAADAFESFEGVAGGNGVDTSIARVLRKAVDDGPRIDWALVARYRPESATDFEFASEESYDSGGAVGAPTAPELKSPKKGWIAAVSGATVLGSALNSFTDGPNQRFHFLNEAFFSRNTYAGGADKTSHFVSYYIVAQLLGNVYQSLGMTKDNAQLLSAGVSVFAGFVTELGDGRGHYGFSYEDFVFDILSGATYLGIHHYGYDDLIGFSFGLIPAPSKPPGCCTTPDFGTGVPRYYDFGQDYSRSIASGNFKIAGLYAHTGFDPGLARFLLLSVTYTSIGYRYEPDKDLTAREVGFFVGVNFVEILKTLHVPKDKLWQRALYFFFDVIRIPYTQIGYVYDLNHKRWHGPTIGGSSTPVSPGATGALAIP